MALKLTFAAHAQMWAEIVLPRGDRIFVATPDTFEVGAVVPLTLETPELSTPLVVVATVVGRRQATAATPAGLVIELAAHMVDRVEHALSMLPRETAYTPLPRAPPRTERQFSARVVSPKNIDGCSVKSLSLQGMTLTTPLPLESDTVIVVALHLNDGEVQVTAKVIWSRPELGLASLRLMAPEASVTAKIRAALEGDGATAVKVSKPTGITVVVADDDASILDFMSRVLSTAGHRVIRAERGDTALQLIKHERPKLIFLDVLMPGLDGLEVCSAVRAEPALSKTPVVLLSAMGEQRLADTVRDAKANDYLTKPMKIESVRAILSKYL